MDLQQILSNMGGSTGSVSYEQMDELNKALTAGYGTDVATLTGGAALRVQSLESSMLATIQENADLTLFNMLAKSNAIATVDEWTEQSAIGGFLGGSTNTETGNIAEQTGEYKRRVGLVKFLMTKRSVSLVQTLQSAIADSEATEYMNGALQLLTDAEFLSYEGDGTVVPTEFDGIYAQIAANAGADHIIDLAGTPLQNIKPINNAIAVIRSPGNFGRATDLIMSPLVQADFDNNLDPAFRVGLTADSGPVTIGTPVQAIRTSLGKIQTRDAVFIRDEQLKQPFQVVFGGRFASVASANDVFKPQSVSLAAASASGSKFVSAQAGNYYYAVAGINANGQSTVLVSAQVAVAAGQGVTLTITGSVGGTETGYVIYRSKLNGTNSVAGSDPAMGSDFREMVRIPKTGGTTTYVDKNTKIPGTTKAYLLNNTPGAKAITWRQFLPMMKFPLYPTSSAIIPWAQLLFGYLRLGKSKHHVVFDNILPTGAVWRPFN